MQLPSTLQKGSMMLYRAVLLCVLLTPLALAGGCGFFTDLADDTNVHPLSPRGLKLDEKFEPQPYPVTAAVGKGIDIEVIRSGNSIILRNLTVHTIPQAQLWLNREYGANIGDIKVGTNEPLALTNFINQYDEVYPLAQFLDPDSDRALVSADLIIDGKIHKLYVRLGNDWREP